MASRWETHRGTVSPAALISATFDRLRANGRRGLGAGDSGSAPTDWVGVRGIATMVVGGGVAPLCPAPLDSCLRRNDEEGARE